MIKPEELFFYPCRALKLTCETKFQGGQARAKGGRMLPPPPLKEILSVSPSHVLLYNCTVNILQCTYACMT